jgi:hypothetical protein
MIEIVSTSTMLPGTISGKALTERFTFRKPPKKLKRIHADLMVTRTLKRSSEPALAKDIHDQQPVPVARPELRHIGEIAVQADSTKKADF